MGTHVLSSHRESSLPVFRLEGEGRAGWTGLRKEVDFPFQVQVDVTCSDTS